jgi:transposase
VYFTELDSLKFSGCKICVFYDCERRHYLMEQYFRKLQNTDGSIPEDKAASIAADTASLGVTMLITSMKSSPQQIYLDYKTRWAIEELFDTHKNTLGFDMAYEGNYKTQEGWAFIEFLALLLYYKIQGLLVTSGLITSFNVKELLYRAATITQFKAGGMWKVCNMTKPLKELFQGLGVSLEPLS